MQIMIIIITISIWLVNLYTSKYFAKKAFFFFFTLNGKKLLVYMKTTNHCPLLNVAATSACSVI